ncbi:hypothetical protein [Lysinibacillus contaminans]|nr:hypothetical protein [Lysinibacillus contaminans]
MKLAEDLFSEVKTWELQTILQEKERAIYTKKWVIEGLISNVKLTVG